MRELLSGLFYKIGEHVGIYAFTFIGIYQPETPKLLKK